LSLNLTSHFFDCGSSRSNGPFQRLSELAGVQLKRDVLTGEQKPWISKDIRKTCATYYDAHMAESSIEILSILSAELPTAASRIAIHWRSRRLRRCRNHQPLMDRSVDSKESALFADESSE
jgi:hypothetical protein